MEYFKYTFEGTEYEFKPNRLSQAKVKDLIQRSRRDNPKEMKGLSKLEPKIERKIKEIDNLKIKLKNLTDSKADEKQIEEISTLIDIATEEAMALSVEAQEYADNIGEQFTYEDVMYILLDEQKTATYEKRYPELNKELFAKICNGIEQEYGLEEYNMICEAVVNDVFTTIGGTNKAEFKSEYLRNRKK